MAGRTEQFTTKSLHTYQTPGWFKDAKLGIFIHWGIYSVPAFGDEWYGHWMYKPESKSWAGDDIYHYHQQHHSQKGYRDFILEWTAEKFNAKSWAQLFRQAGARYVVPVAMHHDSFALYDSALTRWKSTSMGPKQDIIEQLSTEIRNVGMHFGLSNHYAENWWFFPHVDGKDTSDPEYSDLYHWKNELSSEHISRWYDFAVEQVERFKPDMIYFDFEIGKEEFEQKRREFAAYYYNKQNQWSKGVVLNYKYGAFQDGEAVLDVERGQLDDIRSMPWQSCTSISNKSWGYITNDSYKSAEEVITTLVDIVSKNGCLLLNIGPKADGTIPVEQEQVLIHLGKWMQTYGEAIYNTRPWKTFGEGPTVVGGGALSEGKTHSFTPQDIRFTRSKDQKCIYAVFLAKPVTNRLVIHSLSDYDPSEIQDITLLGDEEVNWYQGKSGLCVTLHEEQQVNGPFALRIRTI